MKVCDKTCIFCFFPIISKYLCMAKRSLLSRCPSYVLSLSNYIHIVSVSAVYHSKYVLSDTSIYDISQLLHVSSSRYLPQRVILTKVYKPTCQSSFCSSSLEARHEEQKSLNIKTYLNRSYSEDQKLDWHVGSYTYVTKVP